METKRLILRPWRESDAMDLYEYAKDPEVGLPAGWIPHENPEYSLKVIRTEYAEPEVYAVCPKEGDYPIGCASLFMGEKGPEVSYWIGKPFWNQGFATEAVAALITHVFQETSVEEIRGSYYDGVDNSRRVLEKLGFTYEYSKVYLDMTGKLRLGHMMKRKKKMEQ